MTIPCAHNGQQAKADCVARWFVHAEPEVARKRLIARHLQAGIETSEEAAAQRVDENDMVNGAYILEHLRQPDTVILN